VFDDQILALVESELSQFGKESREGRNFKGIVRIETQETDGGKLPGLLRTGCERPRCCRSADKRNEIAPSHCLPKAQDRAFSTLSLAGCDWVE
jgi:hypothetical protein